MNYKVAVKTILDTVWTMIYLDHGLDGIQILTYTSQSGLGYRLLSRYRNQTTTLKTYENGKDRTLTQVGFYYPDPNREVNVEDPLIMKVINPRHIFSYQDPIPPFVNNYYIPAMSAKPQIAIPILPANNDEWQDYVLLYRHGGSVRTSDLIMDMNISVIPDSRFMDQYQSDIVRDAQIRANVHKSRLGFYPDFYLYFVDEPTDEQKAEIYNA